MSRWLSGHHNMAAATKIRLSFVLIALTLALALVATGLASVVFSVDFFVSTALRFLAIILIIARMALYIGYRRFRRNRLISDD